MKIFTDLVLFFPKNPNREIFHFSNLVNKKKFFMLITLFVLFTISGKAVDSPFNFKFEVNKINYQNGFIPSSPHGFITVSFTPGNEGKYLSVLAENNSENVSDFIVENMFLPSIDAADSITEFSTTFFLSQVSVSLKLPITLKLTAYITDFPDFFPFQNDSIAEITTVDVTEIIYNALGVEVEPLQFPDAPVSELPQPPDDRIKTDIRRRNMDNIDLDSAQNPPRTGYAGDFNASAPAAAASSFKWLEKTYPDDLFFPKGMGLRATLRALSERMKRMPNKGVIADSAIILGKISFIEGFVISANIKFQCEGIDKDLKGEFRTAKNMKPEGKKPSLDFLRQQLEEGEDVEITYSWKDSTGKFVGSTNVVVTGLLEFTSNTKRIFYKHDTNQRCPGGTKEEVQKATTDTSGWLRIGSSYEYYVTCIIAESPGIFQFSQRTAAYINEFQTLAQSAESEFIEIVLNKNIPDLREYRVTVYNSSGEHVTTTTLDQFTAGESADDFTVYSYAFTGDALPDRHGGISLTFNGSPVPGSFISWGGPVTAVNGEWKGLTSKDLNITPMAGHSYALAGTGTAYQDFQWVSAPKPSPGMLNPSQTVPVELTSSVEPPSYELAQNYPNPFNPISNFEFRIADLGFVTLRVYDLLGNEISTLVNEEKPAGEYHITFDASNLSSGVYYYTLEAGSFVETKKMVVLK